jgi:hypothetical protein
MHLTTPDDSRLSLLIKNFTAIFFKQPTLWGRWKQIRAEFLCHDFFEGQVWVFETQIVEPTDNFNLIFGQFDVPVNNKLSWA